MGMRCGDDLRAGLVNCRVDGEGGDIDRAFALDHVALAVNPDQVAGPDLRKMHAEGIDPERVGEFRIARGDVACDSLAEAERGEDAETAGEALLAVLSLLGKGGKARDGDAPEDRVIGVLLGAFEIGAGRRFDTCTHCLLLT